MKERHGILKVMIGIVLIIFCIYVTRFFTGMINNSISIASIESIGGKTMEESYYQSLGYILLYATRILKYFCYFVIGGGLGGGLIAFGILDIVYAYRKQLSIQFPNLAKMISSEYVNSINQPNVNANYQPNHSSNIKTCPNCGANLNSSASFCTNCGKQINE